MEIFSNENLDELEIVSYDDAKKEFLFVDKKDKKYLNFDKKFLKKIYEIIEKGYCDTLSGVDTIIKEKDKVYLIEFKNQTRDKINKYDILKKAIETLSILNKYCICRDKKFILIIIFKGYDKKYKRIGKSLSLGDIPIEFNLCRYHKIIFDEIYTLDKNTFLKFKNIFDFAKDWE